MTNTKNCNFAQIWENLFGYLVINICSSLRSPCYEMRLFELFSNHCDFYCLDDHRMIQSFTIDGCRRRRGQPGRGRPRFRCDGNKGPPCTVKRGDLVYLDVDFGSGTLQCTNWLMVIYSGKTWLLLLALDWLLLLLSTMVVMGTTWFTFLRRCWRHK